jgi:alkylhydroperoxidase/carboxymuconolactone decarboxylase family protein YurZ
MAPADTQAFLRELLAQAFSSAGTARDRQLITLAAAYLDGDQDLVDVLAREHLVDHPDDVLASVIALLARRAPHPKEQS